MQKKEMFSRKRKLIAEKENKMVFEENGFTYEVTTTTKKFKYDI